MKSSNHASTRGHKDRDDLIGEHKWGDAGQVILLILFLGIWITDSFFLHYSDFLTDFIPNYIRLIAGMIVLFFSWQLARLGLRIVFGEIRENPQVIRKGVFSYVRHPIYLGSILLYFGMILFTLSLLAFGFWLIIIVFYVFISKYEENILTEYFGDEYAQYKKEVPMLFPKIF